MYVQGRAWNGPCKEIKHSYCEAIQPAFAMLQSTGVTLPHTQADSLVALGLCYIGQYV